MIRKCVHEAKEKMATSIFDGPLPINHDTRHSRNTRQKLLTSIINAKGVYLVKLGFSKRWLFLHKQQCMGEEAWKVYVSFHEIHNWSRNELGNAGCSRPHLGRLRHRSNWQVSNWTLPHAPLNWLSQAVYTGLNLAIYKGPRKIVRVSRDDDKLAYVLTIFFYFF